jgi:hypothetical protein
VQRRKLPPPAASTVYELTDYGRELRSVLHVLAHWGARSLPRPEPGTVLDEGWLEGALHMAFPPQPEDVCIEFRIDGDVATLSGGDVVSGSTGVASAVVEGDRGAFFDLVVERDFGGVRIEGDVALVERLLEELPYPNRPSPTLGPYAVASSAGRS